MKRKIRLNLVLLTAVFISLGFILTSVIASDNTELDSRMDDLNMSDFNNIEYEVISDVDGNDYKAVVIGEQMWMAENLRTTRYRNGDPITMLSNDSAWSKTTSGAWCWYDNNSDYEEKYGKLYNWFALNDDRGLCPEGWHVPSDEEWFIMENFIDASIKEKEQVNWRGSDAGLKLKAVGETGGIAGRGIRARTDVYGFSAEMGGYRHIQGLFLNIEGSGIWWTSSEHADIFAWYRMIYYDLGSIRRLVDSKRYGFSVRCIKNI